MADRRWHIDIDVTADEAGLDSLTDRICALLDEYDRGGFDLSASAVHVPCPRCGEMFKRTGLAQHERSHRYDGFVAAP